MKNISLLFLMLLFYKQSIGQSNDIKGKVNGISIWSDSTSRQKEDFGFVKKSNANWVSLQPYGVIRSDSTGVEYNISNFWECSSFKGLIKNIAITKEIGCSVFLKPHLMLTYSKSGAWVGDLKLDTDKKWQTFEKSYFQYVIELAGIADSMDVEMFSLGTELGTFPIERKKTWEELIDTVRSIYDGPIIYCANFDAYKKFPFWQQVDYIGIDAYFTIDTARHPTLQTCREGYKSVKGKIKSFSKKHNKKVIFSEFGYHSSDYCAYKPYAGHSDHVNLVAQANAYRAVFDTFWDEPWFLGGISWQWHFKNEVAENYDNFLYTPQNKPAENIIAQKFLQFK